MCARGFIYCAVSSRAEVTLLKLVIMTALTPRELLALAAASLRKKYPCENVGV